MSAEKKSLAKYWLLVVLAIVLDQITKVAVIRHFQFAERLNIIPNFFDLTLVYNTGAAFSFLADAGGWQKWFFATLAFAISGLMAWMLARTSRHDWRQALPLALVIGGAIGNVIDRFRHGHVVDFIQWHVGEHYWPAFNIADCAVVGGAIGIGLFGLLSGKPTGKR